MASPSEAAGSGRRSAVVLCATLLGLATVAYFFRLSSVPGGYFQDTAAAILNAQCLAKTGTDEWGTRYPYLVIKSFGDGKAPAFTYLLSGFAHFTRLSLFFTRALSALLGFAAACALFAFVAKTRAAPRPRHSVLYGLAFCLCVLSPWVLVVHRFPTECTMVDALQVTYLASAYFMVRTGRLRHAALNGFCAAAGVYVYHSLKVMFLLHPLLVVGCLLQTFRGRWRAAASVAATNLAVAAIVAAPMLADMIAGGESMMRFRPLSDVDNSWRELIRRYFLHLDVNFLFLSGDPLLRHHSGYLGMLSLGLLPFLIWGCMLAFRRARRGDAFWTWVLATALVAFVPPALTPEVPAALRSIAATMPVMLVSLLGMFGFDRYVSRRRKRFSPSARVVGWAFAGVSAVTLVGGLYAYFGPDYAAASKDFWRPTLEVEREMAHGNPAVPTDDHWVSTVFSRAASVADGDLRYCGGDD